MAQPSIPPHIIVDLLARSKEPNPIVVVICSGYTAEIYEMFAECLPDKWWPQCNIDGKRWHPSGAVSDRVDESTVWVPVE